VVNARFSALCSHYLFDAQFCNVAAGWEKGVVEKNVQDSRQRTWQEAGKERFATLADLNDWLLLRCQALWQSLPHPEHAELTIAEMLEHEQAHLMPMVRPFDGYVEEPGRVSSTCLVTAARNHYSVPCELAGKLASQALVSRAHRVRVRGQGGGQPPTLVRPRAHLLRLAALCGAARARSPERYATMLPLPRCQSPWCGYNACCCVVRAGTGS
jgi:hypothetical protein